jgi:hypothetical protein
MEVQSGAGINNSVSGDDDLLTPEGTVVISIVEYGSSGNIVATNIMEGAELQDLPRGCVTVFDFES